MILDTDGEMYTSFMNDEYGINSTAFRIHSKLPKRPKQNTLF